MSIAVSIVVPVFNREEFLPACLRTVLDQTVENYEVIVVDDGSHGDVAAVVATVSDPSNRVRIARHAHNRGSVHARITGGTLARGEYIGFVDADDEVEPWFIERLHGAAMRHEADLVQCAFAVHDPDEQIVNRGGDEHQASDESILHEMLAGKMSNCSWNKLVRTDLWRTATEPLQVLPEDHCFALDMACTFYVAAQATRYAHIPDPAYRYMPRTSSVSKAADISGLSENLVSLDLCYRTIRQALSLRSEPAELVDAFYMREFQSVAEHTLRAIGGSESDVAGLPPTPTDLGLLGAVAAVAVLRSVSS